MPKGWCRTNTGSRDYATQQRLFLQLSFSTKQWHEVMCLSPPRTQVQISPSLNVGPPSLCSHFLLLLAKELILGSADHHPHFQQQWIPSSRHSAIENTCCCRLRDLREALCCYLQPTDAAWSPFKAKHKECGENPNSAKIWVTSWFVHERRQLPSEPPFMQKETYLGSEYIHQLQVLEGMTHCWFCDGRVTFEG